MPPLKFVFFRFILMPMEKRGATEDGQIRSFIAIDISREIKDNLENIIRELKLRVPDIRWVKVDGIHLTLKFLGNVPQSKIAFVTDIIKIAASRVYNFEIEVKGLGAFPNPSRAKVVWVGVVETSGVLKKLAGELDNELKRIGFDPENREFSPHLTIGRAKREAKPGKELEGLAAQHAERKLGVFTASDIVFYRSDLKPDGAIYTRIAAAPFVIK